MTNCQGFDADLTSLTKLTFAIKLLIKTTKRQATMMILNAMWEATHFYSTTINGF